MPTSCAAPASGLRRLLDREVVWRLRLCVAVFAGLGIPIENARGQQPTSNVADSVRRVPSSSNGSATAVVTASNSAVLRQKVSLPLELLVKPVSLNDWLGTQGGTVQPGPLDNPFVDDPEPYPVAVEELPPATPAAFSEDHAEGKIPPNKLIGIVGRVLRQSAPVPSLDEVKEKIPAWATMPTAGSPIESNPDASTLPAPDAMNADEDDPFGGF